MMGSFCANDASASAHDELVVSVSARTAARCMTNVSVTMSDVGNDEESRLWIGVLGE